VLSELYYEKGNNYEFMSLVKELAPPGELPGSTTFNFEFQNVEKTYETYSGINVRLRFATCPEPNSLWK
jgi:vacuolar protein sorting-associated protein 26